MNREQRRNTLKKLKKRKFNKNLKSVPPLKEGDRVVIKTKEIMDRIESSGTLYTEEFTSYIKENESKIFTVEFDQNHKDGYLVCLKEDARPIKWLFWAGDLEKVK